MTLLLPFDKVKMFNIPIKSFCPLLHITPFYFLLFHSTLQLHWMFSGSWQTRWRVLITSGCLYMSFPCLQHSALLFALVMPTHPSSLSWNATSCSVWYLPWPQTRLNKLPCHGFYVSFHCTCFTELYLLVWLAAVSIRLQALKNRGIFYLSFHFNPFIKHTTGP